MSDNQIATLIESGWRESNLNYTKDSSGAYGLWQFDKPAGTYDRYKKWLKANGLKDNLESQLNYTVDEYMPSRDYEGKDKNGNIIRRKDTRKYGIIHLLLLTVLLNISLQK